VRKKADAPMEIVPNPDRGALWRERNVKLEAWVDKVLAEMRAQRKEEHGKSG
jgi:hypothetical protein